MTDLNALAERLEAAANHIGDHDLLAPDLRQAAHALRVLRQIGMMTVYHESGNAMTLGDAPAIARSAIKGRDGLE